jgi:CTP synthase
MRDLSVLILGGHDSEYEPHARTRDAVREGARGRPLVVNTRWLGPDDLQLYPGLVAEAQAVVLAPPGPRCPRILPEPIVQAVGTARTRGLPLLATGEAHGLALIEFARNVLGLAGAGSTRFEEEIRDPVVARIRETEAPGALRPLRLERVPGSEIPSDLRLDASSVEITDVEYGLSPDYAAAIAEKGLRPVLSDPATGRPYLHRMAGHPYFFAAAFLPQLRRPGPHPLFAGLVRAAETFRS